MLVIRGTKLTLFPLRDETLESFWRDTEDVLASYSFGLEGINELEISCLYLSHKMTDKLGLLLHPHTVTKISLQSCTATPLLLEYFLKTVQSCCCPLESLESNGTLSDCWGPSTMQILEEIPLKSLRLLGMRFPEQPVNDDENVHMTNVEGEGSHPTAATYRNILPLHQELQELDLTGCQWEQMDSSLLPFLKSCQSLKKVSFKCCRMEDTNLAQILNLLADIPKLHTIDLGVNQCGKSSIESVANLMESPTMSLQFLDLSYQVVPGGAAGMSLDLERLSQALISKRDSNNNNSFQVLRLAGNHIRDAELTYLAKALEDCRLERLDLSSNCISSQGLAILSQGLAKNQWLKTLNIRNNGFADLSTFGAIEHNASLHSLQHSCVPNCPGSQLVDYVCKLNRGGRILLRQKNVAPGLWPKVLEKCWQQKNHDALYYLLQQGQQR